MPGIQMLATTILSLPITSKHIESDFSVLSFLRNKWKTRLLDETTEGNLQMSIN